MDSWHLHTDHVGSRIQNLAPADSLGVLGREPSFRTLNTAAPSCASPDPRVKNKKKNFSELSHSSASVAWLRMLKFHPVFVVTRGPFPWLPRFQALAQGPPQAIPQSLPGPGVTFLPPANGLSQGPGSAPRSPARRGLCACCVCVF